MSCKANRPTALFRNGIHTVPIGDYGIRVAEGKFPGFDVPFVISTLETESKKSSGKKK